MSVEALSGVGNIGTSLGCIGGEGPSLGRLSNVGKIGVPTSEFIKEGPVMKSALKDFKVVGQVRPLGEIRFNDPDQTPGTSSIPEVFTEAFSPPVTVVIEHPINKAKAIWEDLREQPSLTADMLTRAFKAQEAVKARKSLNTRQTVKNLEYISPSILEQNKKLEFAQAVTYQHQPNLTATATRSREKTATLPNPVLLQTEQVEQKLEQREEKVDHLEKEEKGVEVTKRRLVIDPKALARRFFHISLAVVEAFKRGKKSGKDVEALMPEEYSEVRSDVLEEDNEKNIPDGSYELTRYGIEQIGEVFSPIEMVEKTKQVAQNNKPLRRSNEGEEGEIASPRAVEIVYRHKDTKPPVEQVRLRIIKKKEAKIITTVISSGEEDLEEPENTEANTEERIGDNPDLAKLFKLAA